MSFECYLQLPDLVKSEVQLSLHNFQRFFVSPVQINCILWLRGTHMSDGYRRILALLITVSQMRNSEHILNHKDRVVKSSYLFYIEFKKSGMIKTSWNT